MAISLLCCKCWKTTSKLTSKKCSCGYNYRERKYKVRVKTSKGWRTRTVKALSEAQLVETEFKKPSEPEQQQPKTKSPAQPQEPLTPLPATLTISDTWPLYLEWAKANKKSWDMDYSRYKNHLKKPISHFPMDSVSPFHIQTILTRMHPRYKPATIKQVLMLIKRIYSWAIEQGLYTGTNPCDTIKSPKFDNRITASLSKEQIEDLLSVLESWPNKRAVLPIKFALYSGKRKAEVLGLKWQDVDLENKFITLQETKSGNKQTLPLNNYCLDILQKAESIRSCDYVFPSRNGDRYYGGGIDKTWRLIRKKAGITIRFHDLRHNYASYLASSGKVDIYTLKELLGHSDIKMTQRYAHLINGALRKAACVADEVF